MVQVILKVLRNSKLFNADTLFVCLVFIAFEIADCFGVLNNYNSNRSIFEFIDCCSCFLVNLMSHREKVNVIIAVTTM